MKRLKSNRKVLLGLNGKVMKIHKNNVFREIDRLKCSNYIVYVSRVEF